MNLTRNFKTALVAMTAFGGLMASPAFAADNAMKACGAKYQAAKAANSLPAGQTWNQFLSSCRASMPKAAAATPAAAAKPAKAAMAAPAATKAGPMAPMAAKPMAAAKPAKAAAAPRAPGTFTPGQQAAHDRQRACGQQWSAAKAAGRIPAGQTWPQYWSQCNTRMKGKG
jgi:hypothetical protein